MQPDHPVEQVSWNDSQEYVRKLNQLSEQDKPILFELIPDHQKGDLFRLPTDAERRYVLQDRGRRSGKYFFGDHDEELQNYAWHSANSNGTTHSVGQLRPLLLDGKGFYDLLGNVLEWVEDRFGPIQSTVSSEIIIDPKGPETGFSRVAQGCAWSLDPSSCHSAIRRNFDPDYRRYTVGLRLVRVRAGLVK